ncbi:MAG: hypothetical protein K940chlam3_00974 [Chlamydiae bacterium]|nr:hypothetical protein [Chlamydiota bacterium]
MRLEYLIWSVLLCGTIAFVPGCKTRHEVVKATPMLDERLGKNIVEGLTNPSQVTYFEVRPDFESQQRYQIVSEKKVLPEDLQWVLQEILLDDRSYFFNKTKMCLFVPELGFRFIGKNEVLVLVSFSCRQIKFISNGKEQILDEDPQYKFFETNFRELLTHF